MGRVRRPPGCWLGGRNRGVRVVAAADSRGSLQPAGLGGSPAVVSCQCRVSKAVTSAVNQQLLHTAVCVVEVRAAPPMPPFPPPCLLPRLLRTCRECQCFTSPQVAGYETLIRKVIKKAPQAALVSFASFMWLDKDNAPGRYYDTGEDQHGVVARRYGEGTSRSNRALAGRFPSSAGAAAASARPLPSRLSSCKWRYTLEAQVSSAPD